MNNFASLVLPAVIGLVSGIGHGITSHYLDLPLSLTEQLFPTLTSNNLGPTHPNANTFIQ